MTSSWLLTWVVVALSFFITISLLWLGWMVIFIGNRRSIGTWLTGSGLLLGALFFISHTAILGRGLANTSYGVDFWWWVSWAPAIVAPYAWYAAMLWSVCFQIQRSRLHRFFFICVTGLGILNFLFIFLANPIPNYRFIAGGKFLITPSMSGVPLLVWTYLIYSFLCYLLPIDFLRRPSMVPHKTLSRSVQRQAAPWLEAASLCLLLASIVLAWIALWALRVSKLPTLQDENVVRLVLLADLIVSVLVALAVTALGRAIVAYEVFTGRTIPRRGFFTQWRSTVILAGGFGLVAGWMLAVELRPVYILMLAIVLMTLSYAFINWRSYTERDELLNRLRPFISSQDLYGQLLSSVPPDRTSPQDLFNNLCRDVLEVETAQLVPSSTLSGIIGSPLSYPEISPTHFLPVKVVFPGRYSSPLVRCVPGIETGVTWDVPLWNERGLVGVLMLGVKTGNAPFTEEEIDIARAGGERLLDMLSGIQLATVAMNLVRQRLTQMRVLEGQGRRVLHDEVLPELHSTILYLGGLPATSQIQDALQALTSVHHHISDLMRASSPGVPSRLSQDGLVSVLRILLETEFYREFRQVKWFVEIEAEEIIKDLPIFASEVVYFASRELIRNSAQHGRGSDNTRDLSIEIQVVCAGPNEFKMTFQDNGIGILPVASGSDSDKPGAGAGLRFHSAMLAVIGANLEITSVAGVGTRAQIIGNIPTQGNNGSV